MRLPMNSDPDAPEMTSVDWVGNPVYGEMILCRARAANILTGQEKAGALLWDGDDSFAALGGGDASRGMLRHFVRCIF